MGRSDSEFRKYGKIILFTPTIRTLLRELSLLISTTLSRIVKLKDFPTDATDFFHSVFKETTMYRGKNNIVRNDLVLNIKILENGNVMFKH